MTAKEIQYIFCPPDIKPKDLPSEMLALPLSRLLFVRPYSTVLRQMIARRVLKHGGNKKTTLKDRILAFWVWYMFEPRMHLSSHKYYFKIFNRETTEQEYADILWKTFTRQDDDEAINW